METAKREYPKIRKAGERFKAFYTYPQKTGHYIKVDNLPSLR